MRVSIVPAPEPATPTSPHLDPPPPVSRRRRHALSAPSPRSSPGTVLRRAGAQAFANLVVMVRNVAVSAVAAMGAAFVASRGNVFSRVPPAQQSHRTFLVASLVVAHVLGTGFGLLIAASRLMAKHFVACGSRRPGLGFALRRVVRFAALPFAVSSVAVVAMGFACAALPARVRRFKPEYYFHSAIGQCFSSACDANVRFVLNHETVEGRERQAQRMASLVSLALDSRRSRARSASRRWLRAFVQSLPLLGSAMVAGLYIHIVNQWTFASGRRADANAFVAGSLALKLVLQELAKRFLLARGVTSLQHMCIVVGVPTVLVDTQARVVMLGLQSSASMVMSTYAMAAVELAVRFAKLLWLHRALRKREASILAASTSTVARVGVPATVRTEPIAKPTSAPTEDPRVAWTKWRKQLVGLHTAETLADMYAEYIAIVCSAAIAVFWSTSPQYTVGGGESSATRHALPLTLGVQLLVELLVDFAASAVEIAGGVELDHHARGFGAFLGSLFLMLTIVNMNMAAVLFVRDA